MAEPSKNLGLCFTAKQLYYAVNEPGKSSHLSRIGSVDFNFPVAKAIRTRLEDHFTGIHKIIGQLQQEHQADQIRMLTVPDHECWTTFPKLVYDKPDEREAHLGILMKGVERQNIEPTWFTLSNHDFKFLVARNKQIMTGYEKLAEHVSGADYVSDFEIGQRWVQHSGTRGSFMTVSCYHNLISIASFVLGKLRGATYIRFDDAEDLPYLWLQFAENLKWMNGIHESIYVYGHNAYRIIDILNPFWDDAAVIEKMKNLDLMQVSAEEQTYGFNLELAFPAILLALEL